MHLPACDLAEVLVLEALGRDDLVSAAGLVLGMRMDGHAVRVDLAAQLCSTALQLKRLQEVLPVLPYLSLGPEEVLILMKVCQAHPEDPTARFLQLYEASILHQERATSQQFYE